MLIIWVNIVNFHLMILIRLLIYLSISYMPIFRHLQLKLNLVTNTILSFFMISLILYGVSHLKINQRNSISSYTFTNISQHNFLQTSKLFIMTMDKNSIIISFNNFAPPTTYILDLHAYTPHLEMEKPKESFEVEP